MEIRRLDAPIDADDGRFAVDRRDLDRRRARRAAGGRRCTSTTPIDVEQWTLGAGPARQRPVRRALRRRDRRRRAARSCASATASTARQLAATSPRCGPSTASATAAPATSAREAIAHAAPRRSRHDWITSRPQPARRPRDGVDAETIEEVRQLAPQAFHTELFRAVTEDDWAEAAKRAARRPGRRRDATAGPAAGTTIFVAVDPRDRADLVDLPNGRTRLEPAFEERVRAFLTRFRLAGYDIELRPPRFVPLELELEVCATHGYFRTDVAAAVRDALSTRVLPDGTRGFFHPDELHLRRRRSTSAASTRRSSGSRASTRSRSASSRATDSRRAASWTRGVLPIGAVGDRAARQRPELRRARRAHRDRQGRQGMTRPVRLLRAARPRPDPAGRSRTAPGSRRSPTASAPTRASASRCSSSIVRHARARPR